MRIDGQTKLAFVLGHPVDHSLSPVMHQAAFAATGINAAYLPWAVAPDRLPAAVEGLRAMENLLGVNVTVPHKEAIVPLLDGLTDEAEAIGAVNTLLPRGGKLIGDNTDSQGFLTALREDLGVEAEGLTAAILGAGGAARAVAMGLAKAGARRLILLNRGVDRARHLADFVAAYHSGCQVTAHPLHSSWRITEVAEIRLLVNTTSVGLLPSAPSLFDYASLCPPILVCDLIYDPPETPLLRAARTQGCPTGNGLPMLIYQGALAFERWTGKPAPVQVMRKALGI
ncbi:MAG TPA: shikimate dehydrogenase [archaeon]|nr:shikimate dehydrogenase [archaeon]